MILILGASGQLGSALAASLSSENPFDGDITTWTRNHVDYSRPEAVRQALAALVAAGRAPKVIFNAAAYTQVDQAETDQANAWAVNAELPAVLAQFAREQGALLVHYSTDYVYPGEGSEPYLEDESPTGPQNYYGKSKLAGDQAVMQTLKGQRYLIFRTSWVYAPTGKNFLRTMMNLAREREQLRVVNDQHGAPTLASDLAAYSIAAAKRVMSPDGAALSGVYHLCNLGETTWHGFATAIFEQARAQGVELKVTQVEPIPSSAYPTPAKRPLNSRLSCQKFIDAFGITPRHWREALQKVTLTIW